MIFYPVGTLRWLRFSRKTQTPIAKRARQISRPSENFVSDISKDLILYRDFANVNRYTTTKQQVGKYFRHPIRLCPRGNSCQQAQDKGERREKIKTLGITPYEHS